MIQQLIEGLAIQGINVLVDQINMNDVLKLVETDPKTGLTIQKLGVNDTGLKRSYLMSKLIL